MIINLLPMSPDRCLPCPPAEHAAHPTGIPPAVGCAVRTNFACSDAPYGNNAGTSRH